MKTYSDPAKLAGRNKWYSRVYCKQSQSQMWVSTGFETLKEAKAWVATKRMEEAQGPQRTEAQRSSGRTFGESIKAWLEDKEERVSTERHAGYEARAEYFWVPYFGANKLLAELTADDVRGYLAKRKRGQIMSTRPKSEKDKRKKKPKPRPLSAATVNDERTNLAVFFNYCLRAGWLGRTPMVAVDKYEGEIRRRVRQLSLAEETKLLEACEASVKATVSGKRNVGSMEGGAVSEEKTSWTQTFTPPSWLRPLVTIALNCGFRRKTLLNLEWGHLDTERGRWSIPGELVKTREDYTAPVPASVLKALEAWKREVITEHGLPAGKDSARIFPDVAANAKLTRVFQRAAKRAGLKGLTFHDCRRIFLNRLRESGVPLETAMRLSGHKSVAVVQKYYREIPWADLEDAIRAADARRAGGATTAKSESARPGGA